MQTSSKLELNCCVRLHKKDKSQRTDVVERIVCGLVKAYENLTGNALKTILTISKVKEQMCNKV